MSEPRGGPEFIKAILKEAGKPMTTKELQAEAHRRVSFCLFNSVLALNLMRVNGTIKGRREGQSWVWWVEDEAPLSP